MADTTEFRRPASADRDDFGVIYHQPEPPPDDRAVLRTEELLLNMGPQHPSTHGVLRVVLELEGERILKLQEQIMQRRVLT
ncbi:MAG TPA: hypothetical protein VFN94_00910, partial [Nitrospiria bacterium]|nr:hypothetical protein [Nitrospiria bacterium]